MGTGAFGHYEIVDTIGSGGMGVVYRARDRRLGREVAIKVLRRDATWTAASRDRLLGEARAISALNHPNVCTVHDVSDRDGETFVVMELVTGTPLTHRLTRHGLDAETTIRFGIELADALEHAHQHAVVHRDLKPSNVVITPSGRAKLVDFGIAAHGRIGAHDATLAEDTAESAAGTPPYMAPEVIRGGIADARSDIWSLGVLLFECVSGVRPFDGASDGEVVAAILRDAPKDLPPHVPPALATVIRRCLTKDPSVRYQRAGEVRAALEAAQAQSSSGSRTRKRRLAVAAGVVVLILAIAGASSSHRTASWLGALTATHSAADEPSRIRGLAVLPLVNLGSDADRDVFADGMTAALITELARLESLHVISRTSMMRYRDRGARSIREIASELGVDAILEGSVLRAGDRIRISVELVDAASDRHLWADSYEQPVEDVLALQREIARAVAERVLARVAPPAGSHAAAARVNPEAYELYLRGEISVVQGTPVGVNRAIDYYQRAIQLDPDFAPAHAGLAGAMFAQEFWGEARLGSNVDAVRALVDRALAIDPDLADGYVMRGRILLNYDWDWRGAEAALTRAIALGPGVPWGYETYAWLLLGLGRRDEAIAAAHRAASLDPQSAYMVFTHARVLYRVRRYAEAEAAFKKALAIDPGFPHILDTLVQLYATQGRFAEAREIVARRDRLPSARPWAVPRVVMEVASGSHQDGRKLAATLPPSGQARVFTLLGDHDAAFKALETAVANRMMLAPQWTDPDFDALRSDPRFIQVVNRMGLPGERLAVWGRWPDTP